MWRWGVMMGDMESPRKHRRYINNGVKRVHAEDTKNATLRGEGVLEGEKGREGGSWEGAVRWEAEGARGRNERHSHVEIALGQHAREPEEG